MTHIVLLVALVSATSAWGGGAVHVDASAAPGGDGLSWASAKRYLADGIAVADALGIDEVRIAQGVYKPDQREINPPTGNRSASFVTHDGLIVRGGYAGLAGSDPDARDPWIFTTVLSGDLLGDDGQSGGGIADNSLHIVTIPAATVTLSGITITGGNADGEGELARGAAVHAVDATIVVEWCRFVSNVSSDGALWLRAGGASVVRDSFFEANSRRAARIVGGVPVTIERCEFTLNTTTTEAPGPALSFGSVNGTKANVTILECRFLDNATNGPAGAIAGSGAVITLRDSLIAGNSAVGGGGLLLDMTANVIVGSTFVDNTATIGGGGVWSTGSQVGNSIVSCVFVGNTVLGGPAAGGGLYITGKTALMNALAMANTAPVPGGGVATTSSQSSTIDFLTAVGNVPDGLEAHASSTTTHAIVWGNQNPGISVYSGSPTVRHSLVEGGWSGVGDGNISANPMFVAPDSADYRLLDGSPAIDAGLIELLPIEPIDLDGDGVLGPLPVDLLGAPRVQEAAPDLGAFEGAGTPMIPMAAAKGLPPGETVELAPENALPWANIDVSAQITNAAKDPIDASLAEIGWSKHPETTGYSEDGLIAELSVKTQDGTHFTHVRIGLGVSQLPNPALIATLRPTIWDASSLTWRVAPALNTQPSPGHAGPVGDFVAQFGSLDAVPALSDELGDHGVFWDFFAKKGFVWVNVDVSGAFGVGSKLCAVDIGPFDGDGVADGVDLGLLLNAWGGTGSSDIDGDGVVDAHDLALLIAGWGACDGFTPPGGEGGVAGAADVGAEWPRGRSLLDADLNGDGLIDGADLGALLLAWGECPLSLGGALACPDLDGDGTIDGGDLGLLLAAWQATTEADSRR